jgi:hypothetical protein
LEIALLVRACDVAGALYRQQDPVPHCTALGRCVRLAKGREALTFPALQRR